MVSLVVLALAGCSTPRAVVSEKEAGKHRLTNEEKVGLTEQMGYHEQSEFYYLFEYDNSNLYITLATFNQNLQRKIAQFGFTVWIDRTGGKNKEQGFRFPRGARITGDPSGRDINLSMMGYKIGPVNALLERADEVDLIGIYGSSTRTLRMRDSQIRVSAERIENMLFYEAVVPFELLKFGFNPLAGRTSMNIGLETGFFELPSSSRSAAPDYGRRPRGGTTPGGRMSGQVPQRFPDSGMMQQRSENMGELSRPTRLWLELEFAP